MFLGAVAVLGAGVRVLRASGASAHGPQPALDRQQQAADSAARAARAGRAGDRGRSSGRGRGSSGRRKTGRGASSSSGQAGSGKQPAGQGPLDRPGYFNGKLDLDVATLSQIDSLPGVSPAMAKRIVIDRMMRGPFVTRDGFKRVTGVGPKFLAKIDSLVTFTGTVVQPNPADTIMARTRRVRVKPLRPPAGD